MDFKINQDKKIKLILTLSTILIYMDKHVITITSPKDTDESIDTRKLTKMLSRN